MTNILTKLIIYVALRQCDDGDDDDDDDDGDDDDDDDVSNEDVTFHVVGHLDADDHECQLPSHQRCANHILQLLLSLVIRIKPTPMVSTRSSPQLYSSNGSWTSLWSLCRLRGLRWTIVGWLLSVRTRHAGTVCIWHWIVFLASWVEERETIYLWLWSFCAGGCRFAPRSWYYSRWSFFIQPGNLQGFPHSLSYPTFEGSLDDQASDPSDKDDDFFVGKSDNSTALTVRWISIYREGGSRRVAAEPGNVLRDKHFPAS